VIFYECYVRYGATKANAWWPPKRRKYQPRIASECKGDFPVDSECSGTDESIQSIRELLKGRYIRLDTTASAEERKEIGLDMTSKTAAETLMLMATRAWDKEFSENLVLFREMLKRSR
jgi:hypothetical protein